MKDSGVQSYVSPLLTNVSLAYRNAEYISEKLAPIVQVKKDSGQITSYAMDNLRLEETIRAIGASTKEVNHSVSIADHYRLNDHALKMLVADEDVEDADDPIKPKTDATEALTDMMWVAKEKALADVAQSTAAMTQNTTLSGTDQWDDFVNSDPFGDIKTGKESTRANSGKLANTLILAYNVWETLLLHPDVLARFPGNTAITEDVVEKNLNRLFGLKDLLLGMAQYNSANEGQTGVLADIWTKTAIIAYIEKTPTKKSRTLFFTYQKKAPRFVDSWRGSEGNDRKGEFIRVNDKFDQVIVDVNCGYLIYAAIS